MIVRVPYIPINNGYPRGHMSVIHLSKTAGVSWFYMLLI